MGVLGYVSLALELLWNIRKASRLGCRGIEPSNQPEGEEFTAWRAWDSAVPAKIEAHDPSRSSPTERKTRFISVIKIPLSSHSLRVSKQYPCISVEESPLNAFFVKEKTPPGVD